MQFIKDDLIQNLASPWYLEKDRLEALARYNILDTPPEQDFDDIVQLASQICNTPISVINLIAENRQWFKAEKGLGVRETPLDVSICAHAILQRGLFEIHDTTQDARFISNPLVVGAPSLRFYTGVLLETPDGLPLGTLCVLDHEPRQLNEHQLFALKTLANQVMKQLELRRTLKEQEAIQIQSEQWQRFYETVLSNTPDSIYVMGLDKRLLYANQALLTMLGIDKYDALGKSFLELGYERWHAEMHERKIEYVIETKKLLSSKAPFTGVNGRRIYEYVFAPVLTQSGEVSAIVGTARDVTNREEAEETLRENRQHLQQITNAIPQQVWTARPDGYLDYVNEYTRQYVGDISVENGIVQWMSVVHPDDLTKSLQIWSECLKTGAPYEVQQRIIHQKRGEYRWHLSRALPVRNLDGEITGWFGTNTDIQEYKQALEAVNDAHAHLSLMVESAQDYAIISLDEKGIIISWNSGAERMFGYTSVEIIGQPISIIFTPEDCEQGMHIRELSTAAQHDRANDERWHMRKNGDRFFVHGTMAAMKNDGDQIKGFIKIARDMTKERHAQELLIEARNAAEAANIAKTEFLTNMSHEIRTPMNAVIGLSNILAISQPLTSKQKEYIKTLQMSADSLLALINDLLDIAKIEARTIELEKIPFSLTQLIHEVISMMGVRAKEKGLSFISDMECVENRMFMGDPTRLRQIMLNLCSNAIKFTERGGIHISVIAEKKSHTLLETLYISVTDTGIGISPEKLDIIFHKFIQADSSINRKYGGTGLGLAITKTLAEIMGGSLTVKSWVGEGSTFTVSMPLEIAGEMVIQQTVELDPLEENDDEGLSDLLKPYILLVEDYAPNILVATVFLEQFGYRCDIAINGFEAIEKIKTGDYAAALMDVQMHGMNGLEATQFIRAYEKQHNKPRLPIIGMTAHALAGDRERCIATGMDDYIAKPFNPTELKEKLKAVMLTR
ncbi:MAG: PAS domain S-box protein [Pseudomonadota bacterium]